MVDYLKKIVKILSSKPKTVFLIDGLGATLTAILLVAVLKTFNNYFGMPQKMLTILSITASIFAVYSFSCFVFLGNPKKLLPPIIAANLIYCVLTLALVVYFYDRLTGLGVAYFIGELAIICVLVCIEMKTLKASK